MIGADGSRNELRLEKCSPPTLHEDHLGGEAANIRHSASMFAGYVSSRENAPWTLTML